MKDYYKNRCERINLRCLDCNCLIAPKNKRCLSCYHLNKQKLSYIFAKEQLTKNIPFLIWFVGFWEGEGCIQRKNTTINGKKYYNHTFTVAQKETDCLYKIKDIFKFGNIQSLGHKNVCSNWQTNNAGHILALIQSMLPYINSPRRLIQIQKVLNDIKIKTLLMRI